MRVCVLHRNHRCHVDAVFFAPGSSWLSSCWRHYASESRCVWCWRANLEFSRSPSSDLCARTCYRHLLRVVLFEGRSRNASLNEPVNWGLESSNRLFSNEEPWKTWKYQGTDILSFLFLKIKSLKSHGTFCRSSCSAQVEAIFNQFCFKLLHNHCY